MMLFKIDESMPTSLAPLLAGLGHDAHHVEDEGLRAKMDPIVAAAARAEGRILLTLDVEFADIRKYPPGSHPGVVLFRTAIPGAPAINTPSWASCFDRPHTRPREPVFTVAS